MGSNPYPVDAIPPAQYELFIDKQIKLENHFESMRLKPVIAFVLLSMLSFNSLLSITGGFSVHMHHDLSFHLSVGGHAESATTPVLAEEGAHHHHELKVTADMDPTVRGVNQWDKVPTPHLGVLAYLPDSVLSDPFPHEIANGFAARAPPDVLPQQLQILRTQVLRL